jgi:hypothetical protein
MHMRCIQMQMLLLSNGLSNIVLLHVAQPACCLCRDMMPCLVPDVEIAATCSYLQLLLCVFLIACAALQRCALPSKVSGIHCEH